MAKGFQVIDGGRGAGCGFLTESEIDAYFEGSLAVERRAAFSAHQTDGCGPCAVFAADLSTFQDLLEKGVLESERRNFEAVAESQRGALRRELERTAVPPRRRVFSPWLLSAAAALALVGFVSLQFLRPAELAQTVTLPGDRSFTFEVPAPPPLVRDGGDFARGRAAFAEGDWGRAAAAFEKVPEDDPLFTDAAFYAGVGHLLDHAIPPAVERLTLARDRAIADGSRDEATYYLALAKVEAGNTAAARELLESIQEGPNAAAAERLLELLSP